MNRLLNNWNLKLTSLVIAIALWGHVRGEVNPWEDATFRVKLNAPPSPPTMMILNPKNIPATVKVKITAPRLTLRELKGVTPPNPLAPSDDAPLLSESQMRATLDFTLAKPGKQTVPVKIETALENLGDFTPKPSDIVLEFAPAASAELNIQPQFVGKALSDYNIENVVMVPRRARVFGPAEAIARVAHLQARIEAPGQLAGELSVKAAPLQAVDKNGRAVEDVRVEPETAAVSAMLREKTVRRSVPLTLKIEGAPAAGFIIEKSELSRASITVSGSRAALDELKEIPVRVSVKDEKAPLRRRVTIELPQGVSLIGNAEIRATIQIAPETAAPAPENTPAATLEPTATLPAPAAP